MKMEFQSFEFVLNGRPEEARVILTGDAYATQKRIYAEGMARFCTKLKLSDELNAIADPAMRRMLPQP